MDTKDQIKDQPTEGQTRLDQLRTELTRLREQRDQLISELGEYARENTDLRENSAYIHTEQKIHILDAKINSILQEFSRHQLNQKLSQKRRRTY